MDNLAKGNTSDIGIPMDTTTGRSVSDTLLGDWSRDRMWWQNNFLDRPYVSADQRFEDYEPGYRFGYESANRYRGQNWNDIEPDLRTDWEKYEGSGNTTWDNMKHAVHDAWNKVSGHR